MKQRFDEGFRAERFDTEISLGMGGTDEVGFVPDVDSLIIWDMTSAGGSELDISGNGWTGTYGGSGQTFNGDSVTFTTATNNNLSVDSPNIPIGDVASTPDEFTVLMKLNDLTVTSGVFFVVIGPGGGTNSYTFIIWGGAYQVYYGAFGTSGYAANAAHRNFAVRFVQNGPTTNAYELYVDGAIRTGAPVNLGTAKDLTACDLFIMSNNAGTQSLAGEVARFEIIKRNMSTAEIDAWFASAT